MKYSNMVCQVCKKSFTVMTWKLAQNRGKTCSIPCRRELQKESVTGSASKRWKGGQFMKDGYRFIKSPAHPLKNNFGYVREHRLIMERHIGRYLNPIEAVHHINGIKNDNRIENLELIANNSEHHKSFHRKKLSCICGKPNEVRGMCSFHYARWTDNGNVLDLSPLKRC